MATGKFVSASPPGGAAGVDLRGALHKVAAILDKILRAGEGKILRKLKRIADQVNSIEDDFTSLSDAELRALTDEFKHEDFSGVRR